MCDEASASADHDPSEIKIVQRGRGKVLLNEGFQYYFHVKYKNGNCIWRCKNFKMAIKCTGSLTVTQGLVNMIKVKSTVHSQKCLPSEIENTVCSIISSSIETAASTVEETIPAMYKKTLASMRNKGLDLIQKLPSYNQYRCVAYRKKRKLAQVKKMAYTDLKQVAVPPDFDDFLLADYQQDNDRILVFALQEAREILKTGKVFLGDGTFKSCPRPFTQLFVIFCDLGSSVDKNNVVPVIYALMPNKVKKSYVILLELIKSAVPEWEPAKFITDFEQASISAIKTVFPSVKHHGCYFHFKEKLTRKAKMLNIQTKNKKNNDINLNKIVGLCIILPLLPEGEIEKGWNYVMAESQLMGTHRNLGQFLSYIQTYWMPKKAMWCCFGERHRTTNVCEGWNGQFNKTFKRRPTTISHLLKRLKEDAAFSTVNAKTMEPFKKRSKPVIERNTYIQHVQMQLINGEINVPLFLEKLRR